MYFIRYHSIQCPESALVFFPLLSPPGRFFSHNLISSPLTSGGSLVPSFPQTRLACRVRFRVAVLSRTPHDPTPSTSPSPPTPFHFPYLPGLTRPDLSTPERTLVSCIQPARGRHPVRDKIHELFLLVVPLSAGKVSSRDSSLQQTRVGIQFFY